MRNRLREARTLREEHVAGTVAACLYVVWKFVGICCTCVRILQRSQTEIRNQPLTCFNASFSKTK